MRGGGWAVSLDKLLESAKGLEEGLKKSASKLVEDKSKLEQELKSRLEQMARR